jgi:hypothetical protein
MKPLTTLSAFLCVLCGSIQAADLVLASKDTPPLPIIVFKDAPPRTREVADTLAGYIEKISGKKPTVIDGAPQAMPDSAIWVGVQPEVKALFPKVDFDFKHPEEIVIAANEKHVVIAGRDRWDPARLEVRTRETVIKGVQQEYGTINAVYTFLQGQLGVRWFWPGELGEDVPKRDRLAIQAPLDYRYHPQMRARGSMFHFSSLGYKGYGRSHEWTMRQRLQLCSLSLEGGHGFGDWWDRYHEKHPEIFALQPDGTRSGFPDPHTAKLCMSNPKVWELWLEQVAGALEMDPHRTVFNATPNDGWASGHCVCEKCTAWDHPDGEPRGFNWAKRKETRPATSDRDVTFANKLGELLKQKYPGKDYRVLMLSYGHSRPTPVKARPADNVVMSIVANFFGRTGFVDRGSTRGDTFRMQFEGWAKIVPSMFWRPNTGSPAGWQQGLPDLHVAQTIRDFKDVAAANCLGIYIDAVWEHWATQGPLYYIMAQLAWNPAADPEAILSDYYTRAFGPAAPHVREYFESIEKERMPFAAKNVEADKFILPQLYSEALLTASQARLDRAAAAVPADSVFAKRVAFIQAGLTHTKLVMDTTTLMDGYWKKKDPAIAERVKQNWTALEKNAADHPYSINWGPVRPITPRTAGLHPDGPPPRAQRQRANDLDLN